MARHSGKNGIVRHGANTFGGVTNWSIDESFGTADTTSAGDTSATHVTTHGSWTASVELNADDAAAANQTLRAGDSVTLQLYSEGDAVDMRFWEGVATVVSNGQATPFSDTVKRTLEFQGNGALSFETVTA